MPRPAATAIVEQVKINKYGDNQPIELWDNPSEAEHTQNEKRKRQAMAFRRVLAAKRGDPNEPQQRHIRFDYSDIHLENENLDIELELHESNLHRQKFLKNVDREHNYVQAKKDADVMLQLKNAVNRRKPNTSSDRVVKSASIRKDPRATTPKEKAIHKTPEPQDNTVDTADAKEYDTNSDTSSEFEEKQEPKLINNLTMFLLSLQTFKSAAHRNRTGENFTDGRDNKDDSDKLDDISSRPSSFIPRANTANPRTRSAMPGSRNTKPVSRSVMPRARSAIQAEVCEKYGIHVKKDHSRSRRTLGDISKLEHDTKFKHVDKFEDRRRKLLAACKDTEPLDRRINTFLTEVDDFKKMSRPDNSLERVLMRSKSAAYGLRIPASVTEY